MTIHDEIILSLVQEDKENITPLERIIKKSVVSYRFEESRRIQNNDAEFVNISPDITISILDPNREGYTQSIALELESDIRWDWGASLRQVKKYQRNQTFKWADIVVIIPKEYSRFVKLYQNEGFNVWLWSATAEWVCERCGHISYKFMRRPIIMRKCEGEKCSYSDHHLRRLTQVLFESIRDPPETILVDN